MFLGSPESGARCGLTLHSFNQRSAYFQLYLHHTIYQLQINSTPNSFTLPIFLPSNTKIKSQSLKVSGRYAAIPTVLSRISFLITPSTAPSFTSSKLPSPHQALEFTPPLTISSSQSPSQQQEVVVPHDSSSGIRIPSPDHRVWR